MLFIALRCRVQAHLPRVLAVGFHLAGFSACARTNRAFCCSLKCELDRKQVAAAPVGLQAAALAAAGWRAVVPDLLGYGGSDKPGAVRPYALGRQAALMLELMDRLRCQQVRLWLRRCFYPCP